MINLMLNLLLFKLWATTYKLLSKLILRNSKIWSKIWLTLSLLLTKKMMRTYFKTLGLNSMKLQKSSQNSSKRDWRISLLLLKTSFLRLISQMTKSANNQSNSTSLALREFHQLSRKTLLYWQNSFNLFWILQNWWYYFDSDFRKSMMTFQIISYQSLRNYFHHQVLVRLLYF